MRPCDLTAGRGIDLLRGPRFASGLRITSGRVAGHEARGGEFSGS